MRKRKKMNIPVRNVIRNSQTYVDVKVMRKGAGARIPVARRILVIAVVTKGIIRPIAMLHDTRRAMSSTNHIICPSPDPLHFSHVILFA
jgi:hypothetical protein